MNINFPFYIERNGEDVELNVNADMSDAEEETNTCGSFELCAVTPSVYTLSKDEIQDVECVAWDAFYDKLRNELEDKEIANEEAHKRELECCHANY